MRTTLKDSGTIAVGAIVADAASGSGVALGGGNVLPFVFTRTGTGDYTYSFDNAVLPIGLVCTSGSGQVAVISTGAGTFRVQTFSTAGAAQGTGVRWVMTALDRRR